MAARHELAASDTFACGGALEATIWALWQRRGLPFLRDQLIAKRLQGNGDTYALYDMQTFFDNLAALAERHPNLTVELWTAAQLTPALAQLRLVSRQTLALLCGHPASVEAFSKRLFLAGLPRNQLLADVFLSRSISGR